MKVWDRAVVRKRYFQFLLCIALLIDSNHDLLIPWRLLLNCYIIITVLLKNRIASLDWFEVNIISIFRTRKSCVWRSDLQIPNYSLHWTRIVQIPKKNKNGKWYFIISKPNSRILNLYTWSKPRTTSHSICRSKSYWDF